MIAAAKRSVSIGLGLIAWLAILPGTTVTAQDRHDRRMDIINETGRVVNNFYATNSSVKNWGRDLLGQDVIQPGQTYRLDFNDGTGRCMFDLRAVLDNGRVFERYRVNVCTASAWRISGSGQADTAPPTSKAMPGPGPGPTPSPGPSPIPKINPPSKSQQDI